MANQLNEHIRAGRFALVTVCIRIVVIEDHAGDRSREHCADIALFIVAHGQRKRQTASAGAHALGHAAHRIVRACRVDLLGRAPLPRQLIGEHILARAHAVKHRRARHIRRIRDLLCILAVFQADQRDRRAGEHLLVHALLAVVLRIAEYRHRQLRRNRHTRIDCRCGFTRVQRDCARRAALRDRAIHLRILAAARKCPVAAQLKEHAVFACRQRLKRVSAVFVRHRLSDGFGVARARLEQRHTHAGKRLGALCDDAVAILIQAHRAADCRSLFDLDHAEGIHVPRAQLDRLHDPAVRCLLAKVILRDPDGHLIRARQNAAESEFTHAARRHHDRLVIHIGVQRAHLDVQAGKAGRFAVFNAFKHRASHLRSIDAAHVHDIIRMAAVNAQHAAGAIAHVLDGGNQMRALQAAAGEDHALACIKLHLVFSAGNGVKCVASVRARARRGHLVSLQCLKGNRHARIAARLLRVHDAVRVLIKERHAGNPAVAPRAHRFKQTASLQDEGVVRMCAARELLRLAFQIRLIGEHARKRAAGRHVHAALRAGLDAERHLARRKACAGLFSAGRIADVRHTDRADVIAHVVQAHRRRAGEHTCFPCVRRLPAAAVQAVFHPRAVCAAHSVACAGKHHAGDIAALAARRTGLNGQARGQQRLGALKRARLHAQERQLLLLCGIHRLDQIQFFVLRHLNRRHLHGRHMASLRQVRLHLHIALGRRAQRIARRSLCLAQYIRTHRHGHRVLVRLFAHFKGKHGFAVFLADQLVGAARHVRACSRVQCIQRKEAPVAGDRTVKRRRLPRTQQHLVEVIVCGKALRTAQLVQVIRRALDRRRQLCAGMLAFRHLLRCHIRPQCHLAVRARIRLHFAVFQCVHAILSGQRHDVGAHQAVKRQARLGNGHHRVFLQRHADLCHLAAFHADHAVAGERVAAQHLRLTQHVFARRQTARIERAVLHGHLNNGTVCVGQRKADLRQLLIVKTAACQAHAYASLVAKAGQHRLRLLRVLHGKTHGLRRTAAQRKRLLVDRDGIFARRQAHIRPTVIIRRQRDAHLRQRTVSFHAQDVHLRARHRRMNQTAGFIQALHAHRQRCVSISLMRNRHAHRLARLCRHGRRRGNRIALRRVERLHDHIARSQQRGDRHAVLVAGHLIACAGAVGQLIDRAFCGRTVFIHGGKNHPRTV